MLEYLKFQHTAFLAASHGLTDEQARSTPTVSALCIGGLIKHVTLMEYSWTLTVAAPSEPFPAEDSRSLVGMMIADYENKEKFHDDESLADLLATYNAQNAETIRVFAEVDLDATTEVPSTSGDVPCLLRLDGALGAPAHHRGVGGQRCTNSHTASATTWSPASPSHVRDFL